MVQSTNSKQLQLVISRLRRKVYKFLNWALGPHVCPAGANASGLSRAVINKAPGRPQGPPARWKRLSPLQPRSPAGDARSRWGYQMSYIMLKHVSATELAG